MGLAETSIQWAYYTFNPWVGCEKVSAGCKNCYASVDTYARVSASRGLPLWGPGSTRHRTKDANWRRPYTWNRKAREQREERARLATEVPWQRPRVFCASLADVFEGRRELDAWRADLWKLIKECTELDWLLLTKRPENVRGMVPEAWVERRTWGYPIPFNVPPKWPSHVWLGTSVENREQKARIEALREVPAAVRFLSIEPLLEDLGTLDLAGIHWVIVGGESGPGARACDVAWIRDLVRQGRGAGAAVFVKQLGALPRVEGPRAFTEAEEQQARRRKRYITGSGSIEGGYLRLRDRKGGDMAEWPEDLRVRELPIR
jgi:protein gp37